MLVHSRSRGYRGVTIVAERALSDEAILQAIYDTGDIDFAAGFSRSTTAELAQHFGIEPPAMLRRMQRLAKAGKVSQSRDVLKGKRVVGWQLWEMHWDPENDPYAKPAPAVSETRMVTLYRAANDDFVRAGVSFADSRETAEAYLDNPGFGGTALYRTRVTVDDAAVVDLTETSTSELAERLGLGDPGAIGVDEWIPRDDRVVDGLVAEGFAWALVRESFPEGTTTWVWLGVGDEPELKALRSGGVTEPARASEATSFTAYHGTNAPAFQRVDPSKRGSATDDGFLGAGFYASTDPNVGRSSKTTLQVTVSLAQPLVLRMPTWEKDKRKLVNEALGTQGLRGAAITDEALRQGYDGVVLDYSPLGYHHQEIVAFYPEQVEVVGPVGASQRVTEQGSVEASRRVPDRQRWDDLHTAYAAARAAEQAYETELRRAKYGWSDDSWKSWVTKTERDKLSRLAARVNKVGDQIVDLLVRVSPRGETWLSGVPTWWIREKLTWEDAVRPAGEALSVDVPLAYGATRALTESMQLEAKRAPPVAGPTALDLGDLHARRIGTGHSKQLRAETETWAVHTPDDPGDTHGQFELFRSANGAWSLWGGNITRASVRALGERLADARNRAGTGQQLTREDAIGLDLKFSTGGEELYRGQWDGYVVAYDASDEMREHPLGRLDWQAWKENDVPHYRVKFVEVRPDLRRRGVATSLYQKLFRDEGISAKDLDSASLTPEGAAFRGGAKLSEGAADESWEDYLAPDEAQYVNVTVLPQMPDIVARAAAGGMPRGAEYMGAGMTGVVFCVGEVAYKVARSTQPISHSMFGDEAEWLDAAARVGSVAPHVARIHRFDPVNLVIVRDCPRKDPDQSMSRWESRLWDLHREIERDMLPHGWTAPEFKPDSYVLTAQGPILVDASMPSRVGAVLARYVEGIVAGARPLGNDSPSDLAFAVRREVGQTLSQAESDRLEALIDRRWPSGVHR